MPRGAPRPPPTPDEADLRDAALRYLGRYAATEAGVVRMLDRRVLRWARQVQADAAAIAAARAQARAVAARLIAAGALDDAIFAETRSRRLARAGRSVRAIAAHLAAKGVAPVTARAALPHAAEHDLAAAVMAIRRRRLGPFAPGPPAAEDGSFASRSPIAPRALAFLARRGFPESLAREALLMSREDAERLLQSLRDRD